MQTDRLQASSGNAMNDLTEGLTKICNEMFSFLKSEFVILLLNNSAEYVIITLMSSNI